MITVQSGLRAVSGVLFGGLAAMTGAFANSTSAAELVNCCAIEHGACWGVYNRTCTNPDNFDAGCEVPGGAKWCCSGYDTCDF